MYVVNMYSQEYGVEEFERETFDEAKETLIRLIEKAHAISDGIERKFWIDGIEEI